MKKIFLMVCLLALAGGIGGFLGGRSRALYSISPPRSSVRVLSHIGLPTYDARAVPLLTPVPRVPFPAAHSAPAARGSRNATENLPLHAKTPFSLPMAFEPNRSQADPGIQFIGRGRGLSVYLTNRGIDLQVFSRAAPVSSNDSGTSGLLQMTLADESHLDWAGQEALPGKSNYIIGNNPRHWRTNIPHFCQGRSLRKEQQPRCLSLR